jgi:hypothetical protein
VELVLRLVALSAVLVVGAVACANNPGVARYRATAPAALVPVGPPRDARSVRVEMKALPWWTVAESSRYFVLGFDERDQTPTKGARIGAVRSRDIALDDHTLGATKCAWEIVPMGDPRACQYTTRETAMAVSHDAIAEARAELRAKAADAGAGVVGDVRCFAERVPVATSADASPSGSPDASASPIAGRLWCEGIALDATVTAGEVASGAVAPSGVAPGGVASGGRDPASIDPAGADRAVPDEVDPAAPISYDPRVTPTRLVFYADASVGMLDAKPVVASTLGIRYRPFEVGFYILDLQRESVVPQDRGLVGLGLTALLRHAIGGSRADAIAGVSAIAAFQNGATNPDFDGLYHGFVGIAYQSPWRIAGTAQPYAQLRAGAAYGTAIAQKTVPMLELHLGLSTPERR